tara:strand:+ start:11867 stop:12574 length:708 start_codon:yes stop_codon:yes gene_type:complete
MSDAIDKLLDDIDGLMGREETLQRDDKLKIRGAPSAEPNPNAIADARASGDSELYDGLREEFRQYRGDGALAEVDSQMARASNGPRPVPVGTYTGNNGFNRSPITITVSPQEGHIDIQTAQIGSDLTRMVYDAIVHSGLTERGSTYSDSARERFMEGVEQGLDTVADSYGIRPLRVDVSDSSGRLDPERVLEDWHRRMKLSHEEYTLGMAFRGARDMFNGTRREQMERYVPGQSA